MALQKDTIGEDNQDAKMESINFMKISTHIIIK